MNKSIRYSAIIIAVITTVAGIFIYNKYVIGSKIPGDLKDPIVYIPTNSSFEEVVSTLQNQSIVQDVPFFRLLAKRMNYIKNPMRGGRFEVKPGWSMVQLIRHLRGGKQAPVNVILNNERLLEEVAEKVARFIEPDSADLISLFNDPGYLQEIGYTTETLMSVFIPNTYEFFWNTSPQQFMDRIIKEHNAFWKNDNRTTKAKVLKLNQSEVYTLASIVERETRANQEKPRMAGVYLNRLEKDMLLQADPTSVFATRDFNTRRVTNYHTSFDSPYNTYKYKGLPPGPISMASISSIDAVLNAEDHEYIFFCAKGDGSGYHAFAKTLAGHNRNARNYRANLRKRGLR